MVFFGCSGVGGGECEMDATAALEANLDQVSTIIGSVGTTLGEKFLIVAAIAIGLGALAFGVKWLWGRFRGMAK